MADTIELDQITYETFSGLENEVFRFHFGSGEPTEGTLVEVRSLGPRSVPGAIRDPFSLLFRLPSGVDAGCGSFPVEHSALGRIELHMTPLVPDEDAAYYEIVFN
jgi:hypothetical protein